MRIIYLHHYPLRGGGGGRENEKKHVSESFGCESFFRFLQKPGMCKYPPSSTVSWGKGRKNVKNVTFHFSPLQN